MIYEKLINGVENGQSFNINFKTKSLKVGNKYLVKDGKYDEEYGFLPYAAKDYVEQLYEEYYNSTPSEMSDLINHKNGKLSAYFFAPEAKDMTDEQLIIGGNRLVAQAKLEGYVLGLILSNCPWETFDKQEHFFWRSKNNRNLILLRDWFQGVCSE